MQPFCNLTLYLSTKVMFTAVFTLNFTQWSSVSEYALQFCINQQLRVPSYLYTHLQLTDYKYHSATVAQATKNENDINVFLMLTCKKNPQSFK
jgi:hypothetical protein